MYQKTAAEHFAEAITRLSKHPHPFAHQEARGPADGARRRRTTRPESPSRSRSAARRAPAASRWHARSAGA